MENNVWDKFVVKGFFGWDNCKWFIREIRATFSNDPSYFSRKRIESYFLFIGAFSSIMYYIWVNIKTLDYAQILALSGSLFIYAGYSMNVIQSEKYKTGGAKLPEHKTEETVNQ